MSDCLPSCARGRRLARWLWVGGVAAWLVPVAALAAKRENVSAEAAKELVGGGFASRPLVLLIALGAMALLPFVLLMVTSFVKISVVLSIVRSALGTQQIPPTQVITGLAIILTVYIMAPVGIDMYRAAGDLTQTQGDLLSVKSANVFIDAARRSGGPLRAFLLKHSTVKDRTMFFTIARRMRSSAADKESVGDEDFLVLVPAFVISELKQAFQIGFILFVPFIVIDMVVANILLALGMHMLSPSTISLPFKLLLFVLVDGWYLITKGLVLGYL